MTYQEISNRLSKCELALSKIKNGTYGSTIPADLNKTVKTLEVLKESLNKQLNIIKEEEEMGDDGYVSTDDQGAAEDLANKGVKVKLTAESEQVEFPADQIKVVAKDVGKALINALRQAGDELEKIKAHSFETNSFEISVKYKSDFEDEFSFHITNDKLVLVDFSFSKELVDVGVKPSGEAIINIDVLSNELTKHFKSLNELVVNEEETESQKYLHMLDMYKRASRIDRDELRPRLEKAAKQIGIKLQLSEAPEGLFYLKVDIRDARKAIEILDDRYRKEVTFSGSDTYYFNDQTTAYDAMMDFSSNDIVVSDTNLDLFAEQVVDENEAPEGGHEQGGDLDVGHQDDEPSMLLKDVYDIAQYAAKIHKSLQKYDKFDGEVDFPQWWQKKIILARDYISGAQHYLEAEEKQPALDQLALENVNEETTDWPEEVLSHHGDIAFKLVKVGLISAKYELINKETGKSHEPGFRFFQSVGELERDANNIIIPSGGTQSSQFESTLNEEEDEDDKKAVAAAKASKGKFKKLDLAVKALKDITTEMKSLAKKYSAADETEKEKIKDTLKSKTSKKKELESLVDKLEKDVV